MRRRLLLTGAGGFIAHNVIARAGDDVELIPVWHARPPVGVGAGRGGPLELSDRSAVDQLWDRARPDAVIHLGALSSITACAADPAAARAINVEATRQLAERAAADGVRLLLASTDLIFDGRQGPYAEADPPAPLSVYGQTKVEAEAAVAAAGGEAVVCRIALCYGPQQGGLRQLDWILEAARAGRPVRLFADELRTPIDSLTLADALLELTALARLPPRLHLGGREGCSRLELGRRLLARAGLDPGLAEAAARGPEAAERPADVRLITDRAAALLSTRLLDVEAGLDRVLPET